MKNDKVELWGDVVSLNQLLISIFISIICTMGLYFLAPQDDKSKQLFFGLIGAVISFIINSLIFKPKRNVKVYK
ncbi:MULTISPECIES: hypothetical protein [Helcococcus]|uniref:Uncharacterized protein n=1 Tax=Helcococcus bovis TaxID=3153252 RepID=A0ABW9F7W5_9FIRM